MPVKVGVETMLGKTTKSLTRIDRDQGKVFVEGETWNAVSEMPIDQNQSVEIVSIEGLTLTVKPKN